MSKEIVRVFYTEGKHFHGTETHTCCLTLWGYSEEFFAGQGDILFVFPRFGDICPFPGNEVTADLEIAFAIGQKELAGLHLPGEDHSLLR